MPPCHLPWCTFLSVVVVAASFLLAVCWALLDKRRDRGTVADPAAASRPGKERP